MHIPGGNAKKLRCKDEFTDKNKETIISEIHTKRAEKRK
jgi:hypothetical protein